jgi:carboxypeptidase T
MVDHHVVYILVTQNPDGHVIDEIDTNAYRRKNMNNLDGCSSPDYWGVDLNRNHSFLWGCCGGSSGYACDETYRGNSEASEPETYAFQNYIMTVIPDVNGPNDNWTIAPASPITTTGIFISLHSYSDEILWPWFLPGYPSAPNQAQMEDIGRKFAALDPQYAPTGSIGYTVDGSSNYWSYGILGIPSFTFEVGPAYGSCGDFFPAYGCIDGIDGMARNFWAENLPVFIYSTKIARQPYSLAYGPDTQNVYVDPAPVNPGTLVALTANITDQRYGGDPLQPITAAEYFIDAPGVDGSGFSMTTSDGSWGGLSENVEAVLDTTGLANGQHYILAHGRNDDGVWGPYSAVFLNITADYAMSLEPEMAARQADPGEVAVYSLTLSNLGANADSYDIAVDSTWQTSSPVSVGPIVSGDSATFEITVTVPLTATNGASDVAVVIAVSQNDLGVTDTSTLTTTANYYLLSLDPLSSSVNGLPGTTIAYTLTVTNLGNTTDTYDVSLSGDWPASAPATVGALDSGASAALIILVEIPAGTPSSDFDLTLVTVTSQNDPTQTLTAELTTHSIWLRTFLPIAVK